MNKLILAVMFGFVFSKTNAQLEITVKNLKNDKGTVRIGVFKDKDTFLKKAAYGKVVKSSKGEVNVVFDDLPAGVYAVSVIHDENENGELDSGFFGIPKEGFGFGNDAMGTLGPPGFEKASITVEPRKTSISITMKYL